MNKVYSEQVIKERGKEFVWISRTYNTATDNVIERTGVTNNYKLAVLMAVEASDKGKLEAVQ